MLNPAHLVADALGEELVRIYRDVFGDRDLEYPSIARTAAKLIIERIANSDALYHDSHHTVMVTLVGQAIFRGRMLVEQLSETDWLHFTVALLVHDIGYLRGICPGDSDDQFVINEQGDTVRAPRGASDAFLTPYHIERGKIFVRHRLKDTPAIDAERIARGIELTRFPVPAGDDHKDTAGEPGLVRAADLIGQLGDPFYLSKLNALFYEFTEIGVAQKRGYESPADLAEAYPRFFWASVEPYVQDALGHLDRTQEGKTWLAQLYSHVFIEEHARKRHGPERAHNASVGESVRGGTH